MKKAEVTFYTNRTKPITINCEVAKNIYKKMKGLMHREELANKNGMLFTFLFPWYRFFWMKNVKIPLDIIFVNKKFEVISISEAPVESGYFHKSYFSKGLCKYVIECNIGFCKTNNIKKGTKVIIVYE